jgi:hypothetical protein
MRSQVLTVADATHGHSAESPELTQANVLIVSDALHAHLADAIGLTVGIHELAGVVFVVDARHRIYVVSTRLRSHSVDQKSGTNVVSTRTRSYAVDTRSGTHTVH